MSEMTMNQRMLSYREAIAECLSIEMDRDDSVIVYGLDVPDHKAIFGSVEGLKEKYGDKRVFGTPLSEDAMTGVALGAALNGLRPVHVHIRVDFLLLGMNQLANMIAPWTYLTGGASSVPLVIRAIIGRGWGQGAQHSKSLQSVFAHIPGLKVIMPSSPYDVKGMLAQAIRDDNPVLCLEHRWLYDVKGHVPEEAYEVPIGPPRVVRPGDDISLISTSWMTIEAMMAAELLQTHGISAEVIDVRTIAPLKLAPIIDSVKRTGHAVVIDYDWTWCGFSAELAAQLHAHCFAELNSPVVRLGFAPSPCPTTRPLENAFYPNAGSIVRAVEQSLDLPPMKLDDVEFYSWTKRFKGPF